MLPLYLLLSTYTSSTLGALGVVLILLTEDSIGMPFAFSGGLLDSTPTLNIDTLFTEQTDWVLLRDTIVATLERVRPGPTVMLIGHGDTVFEPGAESREHRGGNAKVHIGNASREQASAVVAQDTTTTTVHHPKAGIISSSR